MQRSSEGPKPSREARPKPGSDPLRWVAEQPEYPKVLVWDRDRDEWSAGVGAAAIYAPTSPVSVAQIERALSERVADESETGPGWFGGCRFAPDRSAGSAWAAFGAGFWIRPRRWWVRCDGDERDGVEDGHAEFEPPASAPLHGEPAAAYVARVRAALEELEPEQLDKIVLARCVHRSGAIDAAATLERMAATENGGTLYWIALGPNEGFFGLTPETLYRRRGPEVETEALAGTSGPSEAAGAALLQDAKSLREHGYVRDAIVAALEPLASTLEVAPDATLRRLARLHHLRTPIHGRLLEPMALLARLHPTPAVCGTPHAVAEAAIARLESEDRGFYAGAIGWFRPGGESIYVALRGARYSESGCIAQLGAGIVRGSVPEAELHELELKAEALFESFLAPGNEATA